MNNYLNQEKKGQDMLKNKKPKPIDQWVGITRELDFYKKLNIMSGAFCGALVLFVMILMFRAPIVAVLNDQQIVMLKSHRKNIPIGEKQIKRIVNEFIRQRYKWDNLNPKNISKQIEPYSTEGFKKKTELVLKDLQKNGFQGKKEISQKITDVEIQVTEKGIFAQFFKVLIVEKLPLVVPTKVAIAVVEGAKTLINPEGVYINKILESAIK